MWIARHAGFWESEYGWVRQVGPRTFRAGSTPTTGLEYGPFRTLDDGKRWVGAVAVGAISVDHARLAS